MYRYIVRRLVQAIPTLFGITLLSFLLMTAAPGGPTAAMAFSPNTSPAMRARLEATLGVNDPWIEQYLYWLIGDTWRQRDTDGDGEYDMWGQRKGILRGDFGRSFTGAKRPVMDLIGQFVKPTLELTGSALLIGLLFGLPIGIIAAIGRGGWFDNITRVMAVISSAIPNFWLGLILILIFSTTLKQADGTPFLPSSWQCNPSKYPVSCPPIYQRLEHLILPVFTLGTGYIAVYSRYMRASMLDVIGQDYIRTARAKGLNSRTVWYRHGARNALIPIATFMGPAITGLLGGAVLTETIFSWPGLGREAVQAVVAQNYPFVMAFVVIGAVATVLGYIISDILYALIDPRIRFS